MARTYAAELAVLAEALTNLTTQYTEDRKDRREYEDEARSDREAVRRQIQDLGHMQAQANARLEAVEPVVTMVTSLHARITGGLLVLGFIGAIAWTGVTFFGDAIRGWFVP